MVIVDSDGKKIYEVVSPAPAPPSILHFEWADFIFGIGAALLAGLVMVI